MALSHVLAMEKVQLRSSVPIAVATSYLQNKKVIKASI